MKKCDERTDRQTDDGQKKKVRYAGDTKRSKPVKMHIAKTRA